MIHDYKSYLNETQLLLPPHVEKDEGGKIIFLLSSLYAMEHKDINQMSNRINSMIEMGKYIILRDLNLDMTLINQNEPMVVFGVEKGKDFNRSSHKGIYCSADSLIINIKSDDSLFVLGSNNFENYQITFIKPKKIISQHDPFGEEDWND
jgi:hypothetical protein